ncbi:PAS domain-containing protein [Cognatishimia sp. F0-27]|uniref:PAS domain-containing protein n=1 Tax=Cognatishimia sp. F0-27 TaxID=2816855 RepID=UPI001D0CD489|nr:PAS domain-containing protein [Cognatishimia sp. F0-27]MCC1492670.1 PAS domain-containing protein [Cognatishimia sp. F0-27]
MLGGGGNGRDVVSMTEREKERRLASLRLVEAYWHALCGVDQVPLRSEVDPRGMEDALEHAFLIERIAPSMAKFRVAGSHVNDLMGMAVAGMPVSTIIAPDNRDKFGEAIERLFGDPAIIHLDLVGEGGFGKPSMTAHAVLMPLRSDFGDVTRGLGAIVSHGSIGRAPRRFRVERFKVTHALRRTPQDALATPRPEAASGPLLPIVNSTPPHSDKARGFAEDQAGFQPRGRRHLRLVVSND